VHFIIYFVFDKLTSSHRLLFLRVLFAIGYQTQMIGKAKTPDTSARVCAPLNAEPHTALEPSPREEPRSSTMREAIANETEAKISEWNPAPDSADSEEQRQRRQREQTAKEVEIERARRVEEWNQAQGHSGSPPGQSCVEVTQKAEQERMRRLEEVSHGLVRIQKETEAQRKFARDAAESERLRRIQEQVHATQKRK
jgi:hypothetical protein